MLCAKSLIAGAPKNCIAIRRPTAAHHCLGGARGGRRPRKYNLVLEGVVETRGGYAPTSLASEGIWHPACLSRAPLLPCTHPAFSGYASRRRSHAGTLRSVSNFARGTRRQRSRRPVTSGARWSSRANQPLFPHIRKHGPDAWSGSTIRKRDKEVRFESARAARARSRTHPGVGPRAASNAAS